MLKSYFSLWLVIHLCWKTDTFKQYVSEYDLFLPGQGTHWPRYFDSYPPEEESLQMKCRVGTQTLIDPSVHPCVQQCELNKLFSNMPAFLPRNLRPLSQQKQCMCRNNGLLDRRLLLVLWEAQQRRTDIRRELLSSPCSDVLIHCDDKHCCIWPKLYHWDVRAGSVCENDVAGASQRTVWNHW